MSSGDRLLRKRNPRSWMIFLFEGQLSEYTALSQHTERARLSGLQKGPDLGNTSHTQGGNLKQWPVPTFLLQKQ